MRSYIITAIVSVPIFLASCQREFEVSPIDLTITPVTTEISAGGFVQFDFEGNADYVMFYSGEPGFEYRYRDRYFTEGGTGTFSFSVATDLPHNNLELGSLSVYATTGFGGAYNYDAVRSADWTDLTSRAVWPSGTDLVSVGEIDISQFATGKPIYIAFKYSGRLGYLQPTWSIQNFVVKYVLDNTTKTIINGTGKMNSDPGFRFVYAPDQDTTRLWTTNTTEIKIAGGNFSAPDYDTWAVTKSFYLNKVSPDAGEVVMDLVSKKIYHQYIYANPGVYQAVFVCKNATIDQEVTAVKEFTITVTD